MNFNKTGKVFTSKFVGTGPSSYEKKNLLGRGLIKVESHWARGYTKLPMQWVTKVLSPGITDNWPLKSTEVKKTWTYTFIPPIRLHGTVRNYVSTGT
jgi:hypothetical protein